MNNIDYIRREIKRRGYMTATQIKLELIKDNENEKEIFKEIVGDGIHLMKYTNYFIDKYTTRDMYYYNPKVRNRYKGKK